MSFFGFEQVIGLLGLLVLIPFIIVYLIKPKPVKLAVPSLMFFMKKNKISTKESLFRIFQKDYLFYIQLVVLLLLAISLAYPYLSFKRDVVSKNIVFVLDVSASMQTIENGKTRFDIAKEKISELAGDSNTVVFAKSYPFVALKNAGKSELRAFLARLEPSEDESRIGDAMLFAAETLDGEKGRIIIVSDFITTRGVSTKTAEDILKSKGIAVDMINLAIGNHKNIGIVDIMADEDTSSIYIRNFNNNPVEVELLIDDVAQKLSIDGNNAEPFIYKTKEGTSKIEIKNKDDFISDNIGYISNPAGNKITVVYFSNAPSKFLTAALKSSSRIKLITAEPPVMPSEKADIYIIGKLDSTKVLAGTFEDLLKKVDKGASVIITGFEGIEKIDFKGLGNIKFNLANVTGNTKDVQINQVNKFTRDIDFGDVKKSYNLDSYEGDVIAESNSIPLIVSSEYGKGNVIYYGILDKYSSFQLSPDYPVFWASLIKSLVGAREMNELNLKTGMSFVDSKGNEFIMDKIGVFNIDGNDIAVNMLNSKESDINPHEETGTKITAFKFEAVKEDVKDNLLFYLLLIGLLLVIFEVYYVKRRGAL